MRILLVEDNALVRRALRRLLGSAFSGAEIGEAADGAEAVVRARAGGWDAVLMDVHMPRLDGLSVLRILARERPQLPVIMMSAAPEAAYAEVCLASGAVAYINKGTAPDDLIGALRAALRREAEAPA